ncbi:CpsD/CapB family tyrosine-protein kinase [Salipaludibacillus aurantiacus]|uniref:non-specific protein-tyrosine kinase n=1 Tax=Salipaludibacillus aurantiacus TaxID=1601833 RepID=A0A1H9X9J0_9BACI|nr:CpsD/CapB family tyrosine-protein kinase [Salipaludibacillus aurantiacus]SES42784.1 capsular exopolysaccharide family [Salipaludibacillus aurantiacus]
MARNKQNKELSDKQRALIAEFDKKSPISEQFRTLRTNIQFASIDRQIKTIMVTSSSPAEGKSTTIANLGVVLAQQHNRVLFVDSDMRKPSAHFTFQVPNHTGLTTVLTQQTKLEDTVLDSSIPRLDILPSGPVPPNPSELLGSRAMKAFVTEVAKKYDYVLFDAPPVNAVTDPQLLSRLVDGTILVVRSGKTEEEDAKKAVDQLKKVDAHIIGAVLNDRELENSQYYYYYGEG